MNLSSERHTCVLGMNHTTASVDKRDHLLFAQDERSEVIERYSEITQVKEVILISTCNRTEVYLILDCDPNKCYEQLLSLWLNLKKLDKGIFEPCFYFFAHDKAIEHLFRVSCSLDSLIVGEVQILGQIKQAYHYSKSLKTTDLYLNRLFQEAIKLGKRVRAETGISKGAVSISYAAVELLRKKIPQLKSSRVGIIGTGKMGELSVKNLIEQGVNSIHFINRTFERAEKMAADYNGHAWPLSDLSNAIKHLDILISSVAVNEPIITADNFGNVAPDKELVIVDIAAPRNVSPDVNDINNVVVYDIDDLKLIVDENLSKRSTEIKQVEVIIAEELEIFFAWYSAQEIVPVLKAMRLHIQDIAHRELKTLEGQLSDKEYDAAKQAIHTLTNKILHTPSRALKQMCVEGRAELASQYAKELFGLKI